MGPIRPLVPDDLINARLPRVLGVLGDTGTGKTTLLRRAVSAWTVTGRPAMVIDSCDNFRGISNAEVAEIPWRFEDDDGQVATAAFGSVKPSPGLLLVIDDPAWILDDRQLSTLAARVIASVRAASGRVLVAANAPACLLALGATDDLVLFRLDRDDRRLAPLGLSGDVLRSLERARIGVGLPHGALLRR